MSEIANQSWHMSKGQDIGQGEIMEKWNRGRRTMRARE